MIILNFFHQRKYFVGAVKSNYFPCIPALISLYFKYEKVERIMFLPVTRQEMAALGWEKCDVILVTGDSYIDSLFINAANFTKSVIVVFEI
jgi:hypothetical protein